MIFNKYIPTCCTTKCLMNKEMTCWILISFSALDSEIIALDIIYYYIDFGLNMRTSTITSTFVIYIYASLMPISLSSRLYFDIYIYI